MAAKNSRLDWRTRILRSAQRRFERAVLAPIAVELRAEKARFKKMLRTSGARDAKLRKAMVSAEVARIGKVEVIVRRLRKGSRINFEKQLEGKGFSIAKLAAKAS
jgi:hypothetical protein